MLKLIQSGLFGGQLFHVATKELVGRYNACLEDIGLERTGLAEFHIDGWGLEPEIVLNDDCTVCSANGFSIQSCSGEFLPHA